MDVPVLHTPSPSSSTSGGISGDELSDSSSSLPSSFISAQNYITIKEGCQSVFTIEELSEAVNRCKELVLDSEECSEERKWLVRRLIELRHRLQQAKDAEVDKDNSDTSETQVLLGHHFKLEYNPTSTKKRYCDRCCGMIWNVIQSWYRCADCQYKCHVKCLEQTSRVCAHLIASENPHYEPNICPEVGLADQSYRCYECCTHITFKNSLVEARLCDYTGRYYCPSCHWNTQAVIPARVVKNWDFELRPVSRASYQLLRHTRSRPIITLNPHLYNLVGELASIKNMREELSRMKHYIATCRFALESGVLMKELEWRHHLVHDTEVFSLNDLIEINAGVLVDKLKSVHSLLMKHIKEDCKVCQGRGYICEHCDDKAIIFPFDMSMYTCPKCNYVQHRVCWIRKQLCPKCCRKEKKEKEAVS
ncbi:hypothetical protein AAG570_012251 [Ranatra chinensis]|uniref:Phorbol-ester/DAG-type domain-containing protein n=1 Tax=Ranatra chinensis TaxID=642074 RepID=A0ABD0YI97_9HEMI